MDLSVFKHNFVEYKLGTSTDTTAPSDLFCASAFFLKLLLRTILHYNIRSYIVPGRAKCIWFTLVRDHFVNNTFLNIAFHYFIFNLGNDNIRLFFRCALVIRNKYASWKMTACCVIEVLTFGVCWWINITRLYHGRVLSHIIVKITRICFLKEFIINLSILSSIVKHFLVWPFNNRIVYKNFIVC